MDPLYEPTAHPLLEAEHTKRHAIKEALVELVATQPPLTRASAQRHHGWKFEKLLAAKGYRIIAQTEIDDVAAQLEEAEARVDRGADAYRRPRPAAS